MTLQQIMSNQMEASHPICHAKALKDYSRAQLEMYMVDCHGFDDGQLAEWETKDDLACDIQSFGWEIECLEYLA
jgi:hypothetical protein